MLKYVRSSIAALLILSLGVMGCSAQKDLAALTAAFGAASASVAGIEGNSALAQKITTDTAAAVAAIDSYKPGTPTQDVVQIINIVIADLNLLPLSGNEGALVALALATAEAVITALEGSGAVSSAAVAHTKAVPAGTSAATTTKAFKKQWNATIDTNPKLSKSLKLKLSLAERF